MTLAIGAPSNSGNGLYSGQVRVYYWDGFTWAQRGADIDGEAAGDESGISVSLSDDGMTLAIGAYANAGVNGVNSGHVRVYYWNGSAWSQRGTDIDGEAAGDYSGQSVSISSDGNVVAIGSRWNSGNGVDSGHVRIYYWNGSTWAQRGLDIDGEAGGDESGYSVCLSSDGNTLAIGAPHNDANGTSSGHVRIYFWNGSAWSQRGADIDGEAAGDYSGYSVSLSDDGMTLAVGAPYKDGVNGVNSGHVRVYFWDGFTWAQRGANIDGEAANDESGKSVALSSDGSILAIGASGNSSGHVRIYHWDGSTWYQLGADIGGEAAYDYSGYSVSLSSDGHKVAIGAPYNGGNGGGFVRVFAFS